MKWSENILERFGIEALKQAEEERVDYASGRRMMDLFADTAGLRPQRLHLVPTLFARERYRTKEIWLEFRIGMEKLYSLRNIREFMLDVDDSEEYCFGKQLTVNPACMEFADGISAKLWEMLRKCWRDEESAEYYANLNAKYYRSGGTLFFQKKFFLTPSRLMEFLDIMEDTSFSFVLDEREEQRVKIIRENIALELSLKNEKGNGHLHLLSEDVSLLLEDGRVIYKDGFIYLQDEDHAKENQRILDSFWKHDTVYIENKSMARFFGNLLPQLQRYAKISVDDSFQESFVIEPLSAEFYFDYYRDGIEVRPLFRYGEAVFNPAMEQEPASPKERILVRNQQEENALLSCFWNYGFTKKGQVLLQEDEEKCYEFLTEMLPVLSERAEIFYADGFAEKPVHSVPKITAGVSVNDENLLELTFQAKNIDVDEILDILASYRQKRKYHRLKDGSFVTLGERQLRAMADFVESAGLRQGMADEEQKLQLPLSHAMYLDQMAREDESLRLERSKRFRALVRDIRHTEDVELEPPKSLQNILRDYQVTGFGWLSVLASYHLGGILADDMGLGKTLQVIAFLLANRDEKKPPSLVVVPTSLMYNWLDEMERFAPELKAVAVAGSKKEREKLLEGETEYYDVLVTTYNMLKRDIALYEKKSFRYCFLDEAQQIKNPTTQNAKAVKKIHTDGYFALTGTPIENTLTELWSIFDFLMPGYLGNHKKFKERYEIPIVRAQDVHAMKELKRHILPFILRRLKKDVLRELPDKVESRRVNEMTPKQAKLYRAYFLKSQKEFAAILQGASSGEAKIKILAILTRLRQLACDPSLFLEDYDGGSGKLDMLEEIVGEAMESEHRILIFSQFTTMLQLIGRRLHRMQVDYFYLDGTTPSLERMRLVKEFNAGKTPVFLISLKAGGTGLNLTGADMVIHFDPWWNPAVEEQATDRAYRIGQQKNVQVLKLITKDTVEEKIYKLQEKKKKLIGQMIQPGESFLTRLTEEEIEELFRGK